MMKEKRGKKGNEWREKLNRKEDEKVREEGRDIREKKERNRRK